MLCKHWALEMRLGFCFLYALLSAAQCIGISSQDILACHNRPAGRVNGEEVCVNPRWVGHPFYIALLGRLGYVRNMRACSYGLDTSFSVAPGKSKKQLENDIHIYVRKPQKDTPYLGVAERDAGYSVEFHRTLVHMFGLQKSGRLAIESEREGSFAFTLRKDFPSPREMHYALAALLLLCEGVDVPIKATDSRVSEKGEQACKGVLENSERAGLGGREEPLSETRQVIDFFLQNKDRNQLPCTYGDFQTGAFLESPLLLILTYIGEYAASADELMSVMECALEILEGMGLADSLEDPAGVVSRLFVPASQMPQAEESLGPFLEALPALASMERLEEFVFFQTEATKKSERSSASGGERCFDDCGAPCEFLGACLLLPYLAFDSEEKAYQLEGLLSGAEGTAGIAQTREFFRKLQAHVERQSFSLNFMDDSHGQNYSDLWLMVHAQFQQALGSLEPTLLNQMRTLAQMTGRPKAVVDELAAHQRAMDAEKRAKLSPEAIESVRALLRSISVDKNVKVKIEEHVEHSRPGGHMLTVKSLCKDGARGQVLKLLFSEKGTSIETLDLVCSCFSESAQKKLDMVLAQYRQHTEFSSFVLAEYISRVSMGRGTCSCSRGKTKELQEAARRAVHCSPGRPASVLLALPAAGGYFRETLVSALVLCAEQQGIKLDAAHPVGRLIANVIGSADLGDWMARDKILAVPVGTGTLQSLCPTVQLSDRSHQKIWRSNRFSRYDGVYSCEKSNILTQKSLMRYLREYEKRESKPLLECWLLNGHLSIGLHCEYFFAADPAETLEEVCALVLAGRAGEDLQKAEALATQLWLSWLILLLEAGVEKQGDAIRKMCKTFDSESLETVFGDLSGFWNGVDLGSAIDELEKAKDFFVEEGYPKTFEKLQQLLCDAHKTSFWV
ncbi:uncharacterized protein NEMAJ01_2008 [Nematocida major]|uniref:uncharacterized protein n=1 Tax=Nematocida major TaxID=1912982 RepID=UPI00200760B8|nr:uncharacterized protein NEMAJ01_2008 [Nematocida major]KAH9387112.1 hypothetical protein NEMAJ01_2008 [Nematocida major]